MLLVEGASDFQTAEQLSAEEELISNFLIDEASHPATCNVVEGNTNNVVERTTDNIVEEAIEDGIVRQ